MGNENFQKVDIIWNNVHEQLFIPLKLKAVTGEYNGRVLRIQVTDNGVIVEQKGSMQFGFVCQNGTEGLLDVPIKDAAQGIYEVAYPSDMLKEAGVVACALKLVDGEKRGICKTENFGVEVIESVIHDGMEVAENSITAFDKALIDINSHERRIVWMELNIRNIVDLFKTAIPNLDVPVSTRLSTDDFNAYKVNFNELLINMSPPKNKKEFTSPGSYTWTCPQGINRVYVDIYGAGGGGGGGGSAYSGRLPSRMTNGYDDVLVTSGEKGGRGGGGAYARIKVPVEPNRSYKIIVGGGGEGGDIGRGNPGEKYVTEGINRMLVCIYGMYGEKGSNGGASSFESYLVGGGEGGNGGRPGYHAKDSRYTLSSTSSVSGGTVDKQLLSAVSIDCLNGQSNGNGYQGYGSGGYGGDFGSSDGVSSPKPASKGEKGSSGAVIVSW